MDLKIIKDLLNKYKALLQQEMVWKFDKDINETRVLEITAKISVLNELILKLEK